MRKGIIVGLVCLAVMLVAGTAKADVLQKFNLSGDIVYDVREGCLGAGGGIDIAKWKDGLIIARVEGSSVNDKTKVGAGLGIDIAKGLRALGATWISEDIKSSLCVLAALDISDLKINSSDYTVQVILTVLKWEF